MGAPLTIRLDDALDPHAIFRVNLLELAAVTPRL